MSDDNAVFANAEARMEELSQVDTKLRAIEVSKDQDIKVIVDEYAPQIDPLTKRRKELVNGLAEFYVEHELVLTGGQGKEVVLRSGTLKSRSSQGSLIIEDEVAAMDWLRKHRLIKLFTRLGKRTINKTALKKQPDIVEQMPGVSIDAPERLHIKLARTAIELTQELLPFRVRTK